MSAVVPAETKAFERWLVQQGCWTSWPLPIAILAFRAVTAHQKIYDERFADERESDPSCLQRAKADLAAFVCAHEEFRRQSAPATV